MHFVVVWITLYETLFVDKQSISRYKHNMKEDVKKYLGLKVRAIREAAGMTQEELAATCDVSWRTISNLERGTVVPDLVMIYKIPRNSISALMRCLITKSPITKVCLVWKKKTR